MKKTRMVSAPQQNDHCKYNIFGTVSSKDNVGSYGTL